MNTEIKKMSKGDILAIVLGKLTLHDAVACEDVPSLAADDGGSPLVAMIRRVVDQAIQTCGEDATEALLLSTVWNALALQTELLRTASWAVYEKALIKKLTISTSGFVATPTREQINAQMDAYIAVLEQMTAILRCAPASFERLTVPSTMAKELQLLPDVFDFLASRRSHLRETIHPKCSRTSMDWVGSDADRADETLSLYETIVLRAGPVECPENWSFHDSLITLQDAMMTLLSDMHHLCDASKLSWEAVLARGDLSYKSDFSDTLVSPNVPPAS